MEWLKELFKQDRFAEYTGIEILEAEPGKAKAKLEIRPEHLNGLGTIHGGAIFTLADLTFAVAANSHGNASVAVNVNISFLKAVGSGVLYAEAREVSLSHKLGSYQVDITNETGELIATFQGMAYRKKDLLPEYEAWQNR